MRTAIVLALMTALILALSPACSASDRDGSSGGNADSDGDGDSDSDSDTGTSTYDQGCTMMDILFVIDDSGSMRCEQEMLIAAFPQFIQVIEDYNQSQGGGLSYRLGVTSTGRTVTFTLDPPFIPPLTFTEHGMNGELNEIGGQRWIDGPGNQTEITTWFSQAADLGTNGPSYEMPLQCMALALHKDQPGEVNEGFLREDSLFILVIITDEDDCSRTDNNFTITHDTCTSDPLAEGMLVPLQSYKDYLDERFGSPSRYVVVTIAGLDGCGADAYPTTCNEDSSYAGAKAAIRLQDFMDNYIGAGPDDNGLFSDICTNTMTDALQEALEKMTVACDEFPIY